MNLAWIPGLQISFATVSHVLLLKFFIPLAKFLQSSELIAHIILS